MGASLTQTRHYPVLPITQTSGRAGPAALGLLRATQGPQAPQGCPVSAFLLWSSACRGGVGRACSISHLVLRCLYLLLLRHLSTAPQASSGQCHASSQVSRALLGSVPELEFRAACTWGSPAHVHWGNVS